MIPTEMRDHLWAVTLKNATPHTTWYVGLFEGNYTPVEGDTMATFPGNATELTAYAETQRPVFVPGDVAGGSVDNIASPAVFTGTVNGKRITGAFLSSSPVKGSTTGILGSAVRLPSPRSFDAGAVHRAKCPMQITTA